MAEAKGSPAGRRLSALVLAGMVLLILGPLLLSRGFVLVGDMVFVPQQPWKDQWLGADGSVPRAVPGDAVASLITQVLPGDLLQKLVLLGLLIAAGWGMRRLTAQLGPWAATAAGLLYVWNPFVYERLAIGHWALLCGYAALPWVVLHGQAIAREGLNRRRLAWLAVPLMVAALTSPTGGLLAAVVAVTTVGRRAMLAVLGAALCVNLPWLLPGVLNPGRPASANGIEAFAAQGENALGVVGAILGFGGLWKVSVAPGLPLVFAVLSLLVAVGGLVGVLIARRQSGPAGSTGLIVLAVGGLMLAFLPTIGIGRDLVGVLVEQVPGAGILRDSQKWIAPYVVLICCGWAQLVAEGQRRLRQHPEVGWLGLGTLIVLPVVALPTLVWGLSGAMRPAEYPDEWSQVAELLDGDATTVVLPWSTYRRYPWAHGRAVLDPAFRFFPGRVLTDDSLVLDADEVVTGESPEAARITAALADGQSGDSLAAVLADLGVGWVLVELDTPGAAPTEGLGGQVVHRGEHLELIALDNSPPVATYSSKGWIYAVDLAAGLGTLGLLSGFVRLGATRRYSQRRITPNR